MSTPSSKAPTAGAATASPSTGTGSVYTHTDFTFVRRKRKPSYHHHFEEETGELNIVPYLDIVVNLIMFLLVTQATLVTLGIVDVTAPTYAIAVPGQGKPGDESNDLKLTLGVAQDGFYIAAKGGVLPGEEPPAEGAEITPDNVTKKPPTIPMVDGKYDFAGLTQKLRQIKTVFPNATAIFFAADQGVPYDIVVKALDASREDAKGPLFPDVAFSKLQ